MDRAVLALSALLLNTALGGPRSWYVALGISSFFHTPVQLIRLAERKLNRDHRTVSERQTRGLLLAAAIMVLSVLAGLFGGWLFRHSNLGFIELLIVAAALPVRPCWDIAAAIQKALKSGDLPKARQALAGTVWRHHALLDEYGAARAAIEILAVGFSEKILAPALWYVLFGLPGLLLSKSIYLLQETLAPQDSSPPFARAAKAVHYVLHYIPSRLAAALCLLSSFFLVSGKWREGTRRLLAGFARETPQALALLSAGCALGLVLGGPSSAYAEKWLGVGTPKVIAPDIKRGLYLFTLLHLLVFILLGFLL